MSKNTTDKPAFFVIRDAVRASGLKPNLRYTLMTLCDGINTDRGDWRVWPSQKTLAEDTGFGERSIRRFTHELRDLGFLSINAVKCQKGEYYEYTISYKKLRLTKKGEAPANCAEAAAKWTEAPDRLADKEQNYKSKEKTEGTSYRTAASPSAIEQTPVLPETPETLKTKGEVLVQNFTAERCRDNHTKTGLRFYMECGRKYYPNNQKFAVGSSVSIGQLNSIHLWFKELSKSGCAVMDHTMKNWSRLREELRVGQTTPTISALEKAGYKELYDDWQKSQRKASLRLVATNLQLQEQAA